MVQTRLDKPRTQTRLMTAPRSQTRAPWLVGLGVSLFALVIYIITLSPTINFIDSGELITVGVTAGIAHPPGYPLYTLLSIIGARLPFSDPAVGVNLVSAVSGALAVGLFYALLYELIRHHLRPPKVVASGNGRANSSRNTRQPARPKGANRSVEVEVAEAPAAPRAHREWAAIIASATAALLLCASLTFWSWSTQAKNYSLHYVFVAGLFYVVLRVRRSLRGAGAPGPFWPPRAWPAPARWLVLLAFGVGLLFTNHPMAVVLMPPLAVLLFWPQPQPRSVVEAKGRAAQPETPLWRWPQGRWMLRYSPWLILAGLVPLVLIYAYIPLRSAQHPILDWGSPNNWGDFWRHVTLWQSRVLLGRPLGTPFTYLGRTISMATDQLGPWLGLIVLVLAIAGAVRLARSRASLPFLAATGLLVALTFYQTFNFQNAEVAAYAVPMYMAIIAWAGVGLYWLFSFLSESMAAQSTPADDPVRSPALLTLGAVSVVLAASALVWNIGRTGHANDHLAEAYVQNQFKNFAPNAIVLTNNWYLVSPGFYMQHVRNERPDLTIIDRKLLQYPFYYNYIKRQHPDVIESVKDMADPFGTITRRWVDGEQVDSNQLSTLYFNMMHELITRNVTAGRPVYLAWHEPGQEEDFIAKGLSTHPEGMALRVDAQPFTGAPLDPQFDWRGILTDVVPKESIALLSLNDYPLALDRLSTYARQTNYPDEAARFEAQAAQVRAALGLTAR